MSWLTELAESAWNGITSIGKSIVNVAGPIVATVVETLKRGVDAIQDALKKEFRAPPSTERERVERDLEEVNERIMRLRKRHYERGLSESDKRENEHLRQQRADLIKELDALDQVKTAEDIVEEEDNYESVHIDANLTHILQYHLGQFTFNKTCPQCHRQMILQCRRDMAVAAPKDFFWGCIGYYDGEKSSEHTMPLSAGDLDLFVNMKRAEFDLGAANLSAIVLKQHPDRVRTAMRDVIANGRRTQAGVDGYRCPVHKERLVLHEKKSSNGLLDQFFLGCPRYDPDKRGCNYKVKIKSPAQFSAIFDAKGEGGLIQVIGGGSKPPGPANHGKPWTEDLAQQVARAYEQGVSVPQIAEIFQRSPISIYLKLESLGKLTHEQVEVALGRHAGIEAGQHTRH
jgi:hypothetical protein